MEFAALFLLCVKPSNSVERCMGLGIC